MRTYTNTTAQILVKIEAIIKRELTSKEETLLIDSIEAHGITDPDELIRMFDLD